MSFPIFYDSQKVGRLYSPQIIDAIEAGKELNVRPASEDKERALLLLVDPQVDFIHVDGSLSVPGAVADTRRTIEWIFDNLESITSIVASLDTHTPLQIFYPTWWINAAGQHPDPFTPISYAEIEQGNWIPTIEAEWSTQYVKQLEERAKKTLMIWPYHTMIGEPGHAITPALYEAISYHAAARDRDPTFIAKGTIPKTEHYSLLEPEVKVPDVPMGALNIPLLEMIAEYDLIYVAGQAKSHCVLETVTSLVRYFGERDPEFVSKWRLLMDCTSSVAHPEIDFDEMANEQFAHFVELGLQLVTTGDVIS